MLNAFTILGLAWLALSVSALRASRAIAASLPTSSHWRSAHRLLWLPGLALGVASLFIAISYTARVPYTLYGFPFQAFGIDARGRDFVGIFTLPLMLADIVCWFGLPHAVYWLARRSSESGLASGAN